VTVTRERKPLISALTKVFSAGKAGVLACLADYVQRTFGGFFILRKSENGEQSEKRHTESARTKREF
jgi:hypothetical protein